MQVRKDLHTRRSPTQSDIYQMSYSYNWLSWWWARSCSKHVENWNKHIKKKNCASSWLLTRSSMVSRIWCPLEAISKPHAPTALTPILSCSPARSVGPKVFVGALVCRKSLYIRFWKRLTNVIRCVNVSSSRWNVSTTNVTIFRVARTRIQPCEWPKHVGGYYTITLKCTCCYLKSLICTAHPILCKW